MAAAPRPCEPTSGCAATRSLAWEISDSGSGEKVSGRAPGVPITYQGVSTNGVALDMGLDSATFATAGTATLTTIANAWRYRVGQWLCLLNGGVSGAAMMSQITAINATTGVLSLSPAPLASGTGQIALTNRFNPNAYGASGPPSSIGSTASISQGAHLCAGTHDYRRADLPLQKLPISIGEGAWICADAFIGPGVKVGNYAIVGARAVAMRIIEDWSIVAGNPARVIGTRPAPVSD